MQILYGTLFFLFLTSCSQGFSRPGQATALDSDSFKLANAWLEAFEHQDTGKMKSIISSDGVVHGFAGEDELSRDRFIEHLDIAKDVAGLKYSPFSDHKWLPLKHDDALFGGEGILFWGISTMNYEKWGSSSFPIHIVTTVENGKISSMHFYYNRLKMFRAVGFKLLPPPEEQDIQN